MKSLFIHKPLGCCGERTTRWLTPLRMSFMLGLFLLAAFVLPADVKAQTITVDGDPSDWPAVFKTALANKAAQTFRRDANNTDDDQWTGGSQDPDLVDDWYWVSGNTNDKGDISNAGAVLLGKTIYFFGDRTAVNGDAQIAFWFFLKGIAPGNQKGKGGFRFTGENAEGDVLAISNFINGGGAPSLIVYKRDANLVLQVDNSVTTQIATNKNKQKQFVPAGVTTSDAGWPFSESWTFTPKSGGIAGEYPDPLFFEGSIDFTNEPDAELCFNRFLLETRNSQSLGASLQDFVAGEFNVVPNPPTVTGDEACVDNQPVVLTASCSSGGSSPRWYTRNNDGTYTLLTTSDGVSADGTTLTKSGLSVGTHTFYASCYNTALGCESEKREVSAVILPLPSVDGVVTEGENNNNINDGITKVSDDVYDMRISLVSSASLSASASGGTGSYSYVWTRIDCTTGGAFTDDGKTSFTSSGATGTFTVLSSLNLADRYCFKVTVTDGKTCVATDIVEIRPTFSCPPCGIIGTAVACKDAQVTYTYGNPGDNTAFSLPADYDLTWTKPDGTTATNVTSITVTLSTLGTNTVSIAFTSKSGLVNNCPGCSTTTDVRQVSCTATLVNGTECTASNGSATANPSGGTAPYTYLWDNGETTQTAVGLGQGTHTVEVTDNIGCKSTCTVEIPVLPCAHIFPTATACCHFTQGIAQQQVKVCYTKSGSSISNVIPGVFFYYSYVTAPLSGPFVLSVTQNVDNANFKLFSIQNVSQLRLLTTDCSSTGITFTGAISGSNNGIATFNVTGYTPGATYVVSVKYEAKSIEGSSFGGTPTANYTFASTINGSAVSGSSGVLQAVANCSDNTPATPNCTSSFASTNTTEVQRTDDASELKLATYPNPYSDVVNFRFASPRSGKAVLEVYDILGRRLAVVYQGNVLANTPVNVKYNVPAMNRISLVYKLTVDNKSVRGSILPDRQQ